MKTSISIEGMDWLKWLDEGFEDGLEFGLETIARELEPHFARATPYDHYTEDGANKAFNEHIINQWEYEMSRGKMQALIFNPSDYGQILDEGLYLRSGARTVVNAGGIFSNQAPAGIVGPIITDERLMIDMLETFEAGLGAGIEHILTRR